MLPDPPPVLFVAAPLDVLLPLVEFVDLVFVTEDVAIMVVDVVFAGSAVTAPAVMTTGTKDGYSDPVNVAVTMAAVTVAAAAAEAKASPDMVVVHMAWVASWRLQSTVSPLEDVRLMTQEEGWHWARQTYWHLGSQNGS